MGGDGQRGRQGLRQLLKQRRHLGGRFEPPLGVGAQQHAGLIERSMRLDAGQHILQLALFGSTIVDIVGRHQRQPLPAGQVDQRRGQPLLFDQQVVLHLQPVAPSAEGVAVASGDALGGCAVPLQQGAPQFAARAAGEAGQAAGVLCQQVKRGRGLPFLVPQLGGAEQAAEVAVAPAVTRQQRHVSAAIQRDLTAEQRLDLLGARRGGKLHGAVEAVVVGDRYSSQTKRRRPCYQLVRRRCAVQEAEVGMQVQFGVG